jgi:hypothetical protein
MRSGLQSMTFANTVLRSDGCGLKLPLAGSAALLIPNSEARTFLRRLTGRYTNRQKRAVGALIRKLVLSGVWQKLDCLWIFRAANQADALLNWVAEARNCLAVASPEFIPFFGFTTSTTAYLNTQYQPDGSLNWKLNSATFGILTDARNPSGGYDMGSDIQSSPQWSYNGLFSNLASGNAASFIHYTYQSQSPPSSQSPSLGQGFYAGLRADTTNHLAINGVIAATQIVNASQLPGRPFFIGGRNAGSGFESPASRLYYAAFMGGALSESELLILYSSILLYLRMLNYRYFFGNI